MNKRQEPGLEARVPIDTFDATNVMDIIARSDVL